MSRRSLRAALLGTAALLLASPAFASAFVLEGNYVKLSFNDYGTLGQGNADPGLLFDATGSGTFDPADDYLTPGTPFEGFSVSYGGAPVGNNNSGYGWGAPPITGTLTNESGNGADNRGVWTGTYNDGSADVFTITNDISFNDDSKVVKITTTIKAKDNLSNVKFSRQIDPDVNTSFTENTRGTATIAEKDLVVAISPVKGYVLSMFTTDPLTHDSAVTAWSEDPADYLSGQNIGDGDNVIGLGFLLGNMLAGQEISFTYYYLFGDSLADLDVQAGNAGGGGIKAGVSDNTLPGTPTVAIDGQTLTFTSDYTVGQGIIVGAGGATIDTAGFGGTITGQFTGGGTLTKSGTGVLVLDNAANDQTSTTVTGGTLAVSSNGALGGNGATVTLDGGMLGVTTDATLGQTITIGAGGGGFDTMGHTMTLTAPVTGTSCLIKSGAGTLILQANSANSIGACVEQGTLSQNAVFTGNVWVSAGGTLRGIGTIDGATLVAGRLAPGNSPGTLTFNAPVTLTAGSTLEIDIDGTGTGTGAGNYSRVIVTGAGNGFAAAGTLEPLLRGITGSATNSYSPAIGTTFTIVAAEGGISGAFDSLTQPTSGLLAGTQFEVLYGAHDIWLTVTPTAFAGLSGLKTNGVRAAAALDALRAAGDADGLRVSLAGLNATALAQSLQQLSGEIHADILAAGLEGRRAGRDGVFNHLSSQRAADSRRFTLWVEGIGHRGRIQGDSTADGYHNNAGGVAVGGDLEVARDLRLGLGAATVMGNVDARLQGSGSADSQQLYAYGSFARDGIFADVIIAHSWDDYRTDRGVLVNSGTSSLSSRDKATNWSIDAQAGTRLAVAGYTVEPVAGFRWDEVTRDAVLENGSADTALAVAGISDTVAQGKIGARVNRAVAFNSMTVVPELRAYWIHDFGAINSLVMTLEGEEFLTSAAGLGRNAALLGAGVNVALTDAIRLFVDYDAELRDGATLHGLKGGLRFRF